MCRNITALRGLEPAASDDEIAAAALQYVRKVGALQQVSSTTQTAVDEAVAEIAATTSKLLAQLPARRVPPKNRTPDPPIGASRRAGSDGRTLTQE